MAILMALSALAAIAGAQSLYDRQIDDPSTSDFIRRAWHEVSVIDNYLYIYGGEVSQLIDGEDDPRNNSRAVNLTLSINLSTSWTNASVKFIESKGSGSRFYKAPALWKDPSSSSFFIIGGDSGFNGQAKDTEVAELMQYTTDGQGGGSWSKPQPSNPQELDKMKGTAYPASTSCGGLGLYTGSYSNPYTPTKSSNQVPVPGLITYNSSSRAWANESLDPFQHTHVYGEMVCLPSFGTNGLALFLGGAAGGATSASNFDTALSSLPFTNLTFYDPVAKSWYWQAAAGDFPQARTQFCSAAVQSPNGTTEIFIYGGKTQSNVVLDDVYVLSIPAFRWFKGPTGTPRLGQRCVAGNGRQMISIGGLNGGVWLDTDTWRQGIGVLDMTALEWISGYDAGAAKYTYPDVVKAWYDDGGLSKVFWSSNASQTVFTSNSSTPGGGDEKDNKGSSSTNIGAIVGGVIGGVAVIGIAAFACWYILRRRRRSSREPIQSDPGSATEYAGAPANENYYKAELDARQNAHQYYELSSGVAGTGREPLYHEMAASNHHEMSANTFPEPYRDNAGGQHGS
ncbi:hypothetical protein GQ53DRAFT_678017 [Thozetella sp. PMI_491]|nr:hypothetical protein GQ53DRAFT_678017 [Thozetella sp. PMI_491]